MKINWYQVVGWYGAAAILVAYALNNFEVLRVQDLSYQLLNLSGAIGIVLVSMKKKAYPPAALNAVWAVIAVYVLVNMVCF